MAVIQIDNFGGEIPRLPARALPAGAAQVNSNLLATATEFRPLKAAATLAGVTPAALAKTLYRTQRKTDGSLLDDLTVGWVHSAADLSVVRGQVADDTTERTYYASNDGSAPPRAKNNDGDDFLLGIPCPPKPEVSLLVVDTPFDAKAAREWLYGPIDSGGLIAVVTQHVKDCLSEDQTSARFTASSASAGASPAGITKLLPATNLLTYFPMTSAVGALQITSDSAPFYSQRGVYEPWHVMFRALGFMACPEGLGNAKLGGVVVGDALWFALAGLPLWGVLDTASLTTRLAGIKRPNEPTVALWTAPQVAYLVGEVAAMINPANVAAVASRRAQIDAAMQEFSAGANHSANNVIRPVPLPPTDLGESQAEFDARYAIYVQQVGEYGVGSAGYSSAPVRRLPGVDEGFPARLADWNNLHASAVAVMAGARAKAERASHEIEALYAEAKVNLEVTLTDWFRNIPLGKTSDNMDGLVVLDDDNGGLVDERAYVTTFVTAWGEESAPSEPSAHLSVKSSSLVSVKEPSRALVSAGRSIPKWRLYRTNVGTQGAAFQFVAEREFGATLSVPTNAVGLTGTVLAGYGDKDKWRDIVATWQVYNDPGRAYLGKAGLPLDAYLDTSALMPGDKATQQNAMTSPTYQVTKTWNGRAWVMQQTPDVQYLTGQSIHLDGKSAAALGEVCPTVTWLPPPYRVDPDSTLQIKAAKGVNPYLKGIVGMPNGIVAGFVDNFVAFSEPFAAYAWPVEYQLPIEFPIVGLGVFGQTLFVGTLGNPYFISGSDPASMSAQKLDTSQSCVSRRSIVAALGGVFYASPDGYCFASPQGVEVATAGLFSNEDWRALTPSSIFAVVHDSVLYFWYAGNGGGCYGLDMVARKLTRHTIAATAVFEDVATDGVYAANGALLQQLFAGARATALWRSSRGVMPAQSPFAWLQVDGDQSAETPVTVRWYGDGVLRHTATVTDIRPQRLPPGRWLEHEIEIESKARITRVTLAGHTLELQQA